MYEMLRWRQNAECLQFCLVTLVAQVLHKKSCFKPVVGFWICDVCECHFQMRVNGDACYRFTSIVANVDFVLLKWLYGHPSTCQTRSHTTEKTLSNCGVLLKACKAVFLLFSLFFSLSQAFLVSIEERSGSFFQSSICWGRRCPVPNLLTMTLLTKNFWSSSHLNSMPSS